jgi:hypothetical protein
MMVYIDKFFEPGYIPVMLYEIVLDFKIMAVNIFVCGLLFFLYWKNIINRKIILFGIAWFVVCLFPTFLTQDYCF